MKLRSKNNEILNKQKLRKKLYIYLPLTCFLFRNSLTTIYSRTIISSSSGMSCKSSVSKIAAEFSLTGNSISRRIFAPTLSCQVIEVSWNAKFLSRTLSSFCRSQLGFILRVGLTLKSSSKITLGLILRVGLIIGETRYYVYRKLNTVKFQLFICRVASIRRQLSDFCVLQINLSPSIT